MKQFICDRCGEHFRSLPDWAQMPEFEYRVAKFVAFPAGRMIMMDLCRDCQRELDRFLNEKAEEEKGGDGDG